MASCPALFISIGVLRVVGLVLECARRLDPSVLFFSSFSPFRREFLVVQQMRRPPAELLKKE